MEKKATIKKTVEPKKIRKAPVHKEKYFFGVGRRKTARARVKLFADGKGQITVNERTFESYFPTFSLQKVVLDPLAILGLEKKTNALITVSGGGVSAQATAASLGLSRALLLLDLNFRPVLKKSGFLSRDARKKERKKPGLKRARRRPQWQKR